MDPDEDNISPSGLDSNSSPQSTLSPGRIYKLSGSSRKQKSMVGSPGKIFNARTMSMSSHSNASSPEDIDAVFAREMAKADKPRTSEKTRLRTEFKELAEQQSRIHDDIGRLLAHEQIALEYSGTKRGGEDMFEVWKAKKKRQDGPSWREDSV